MPSLKDDLQAVIDQRAAQIEDQRAETPAEKTARLGQEFADAFAAMTADPDPDPDIEEAT